MYISVVAYSRKSSWGARLNHSLCAYSWYGLISRYVLFIERIQHSTSGVYRNSDRLTHMREPKGMVFSTYSWSSCITAEGNADPTRKSSLAKRQRWPQDPFVTSWQYHWPTFTLEMTGWSSSSCSLDPNNISYHTRRRSYPPLELTYCQSRTLVDQTFTIPKVIDKKDWQAWQQQNIPRAEVPVRPRRSKRVLAYWSILRSFRPLEQRAHNYPDGWAHLSTLRRHRLVQIGVTYENVATMIYYSEWAKYQASTSFCASTPWVFCAHVEKAKMRVTRPAPGSWSWCCEATARWPQDASAI